MVEETDSDDVIEDALENLHADSITEVRSDPDHEPDSEDLLTDLELIQQEVDAVYEEYPSVSDDIERDHVHCHVADTFKNKHGQCQHNRTTPNGDTDMGHHSVRIARQIVGDDDHEWRDTVRHELAHVLAYERFGGNQHHNDNWKESAVDVGADPSRCARTRHTDGDYIVECPNCGAQWERYKRSKTVKRPFDYSCGRCDHKPLVSYDAGDEIPDEEGICAVESIGWETRTEWGRQR